LPAFEKFAIPKASKSINSLSFSLHQAKEVGQFVESADVQKSAELKFLSFLKG
jgi:hypothetical protein